jgi:hypothetical protein
LAALAGLNKGTLRNALRDDRPQVIHLIKVYALAKALLREGEDIEALVQHFLGNDSNDGVPEEPPAQPPGPQPKEPRRKERAGTGPRRNDDSARGAA